MRVENLAQVDSVFETLRDKGGHLELSGYMHRVSDK